MIDGSTWVDGPWKKEPDGKRWQDAATGMACAAIRNPRMGFWCGYVGVGEDHPAYGKSYDDVDTDVHGGLTYSADRLTGENRAAWWLGFDCCHAWDMAPAIGLDGEYRTLEYVEGECARLAKQLSEMDKLCK